ncbi:MAG: PD40 domain-containing protein [Bacteroidetes bacterium]|nr:PD40 domain-containing protein [Bacteroidota bacterium]
MHVISLAGITAAITLLVSSALHAQASDSNALRTRVIRLGNGVNTAAHEYAPAVTADGRTLYFVSNRKGGMGGHDFWVAHKKDRLDTMFESPVNLGPPVNTSENEGAACIAADGQTIYFTACNRPDGEGDCDIYQARLDGDTWTDIHDVRALNSPHWESQPSISADGRTIYFASNRQSSRSGDEDADIYVSTLDSNGNWTVPKNLGAVINTTRAENSPFISSSGDLLYFASQGHGGLGGFDLFVSRRNADGSWGTPENLGVPYNSDRDERFITVPASGDMIYFASDRASSEKTPRLDLYMGLMVPRGASVLVQGEAYDATSLAQLRAYLAFIDSASGTVLYATETNRLNGEFTFVCNQGSVSGVILYAAAPGYAPVTRSISLPATGRYTQERVDLAMTKVSHRRGAEPSGLVVTPVTAVSTITVERPAVPASPEGRTLTITNRLGRIVRSERWNGRQITLDVAAFADGIYLARVGTMATVFAVQHRK